MARSIKFNNNTFIDGTGVVTSGRGSRETLDNAIAAVNAPVIFRDYTRTIAAYEAGTAGRRLPLVAAIIDVPAGYTPKFCTLKSNPASAYINASCMLSHEGDEYKIYFMAYRTVNEAHESISLTGTVVFQKN